MTQPEAFNLRGTCCHASAAPSSLSTQEAPSCSAPPLTNYTQPAVNHSAHFLFPAAEPAHQGNYSCVYHLLVRSHSFSSESRLLSVTVSGGSVFTCLSLTCLSVTVSDPPPLILRAVVLLLIHLLILLLAIGLYFCCKATRGQRGQEDMELLEVNLAVMSLQATRPPGGSADQEDMELQEVNLAVMPLQATRV
ncbi:hypothetical protein F7725_010849 [Dissostichus mawsoni]|uniref:Uncharacterized protein n=1 Tax=Dissostichus mawsoni TaxID=36200 RepID=A0A7J5ZB90_DISMA|nr:hypothetical protein F7725_010849 [Dissostichus mawsoni]